MRLISAERAPTGLAVLRHVKVTIATSLIIARAWARVSAKNSDAASRRPSEQVLVPEYALGNLEQPAKLDQGRNAGTGRRLENLLANLTEAERAKSGLVGNAEQVVTFRERANGAAFAFGEAALRVA
jgi:hypothetical protein